MCVKLRLYCFWLTMFFVLLHNTFCAVAQLFCVNAQWIFVFVTLLFFLFVTQLLKVTIKFVFAFNQMLENTNNKK